MNLLTDGTFCRIRASSPWGKNELLIGSHEHLGGIGLVDFGDETHDFLDPFVLSRLNLGNISIGVFALCSVVSKGLASIIVFAMLNNHLRWLASIVFALLSLDRCGRLPFRSGRRGVTV